MYSKQADELHGRTSATKPVQAGDLLPGEVMRRYSSSTLLSRRTATALERFAVGVELSEYEIDGRANAASIQAGDRSSRLTMCRTETEALVFACHCALVLRPFAAIVVGIAGEEWNRLFR